MAELAASASGSRTGRVRLTEGGERGRCPLQAALTCSPFGGRTGHRRAPELARLPFDAAPRRMAVLPGRVLHVKGSPESVLGLRPADPRTLIRRPCGPISGVTGRGRARSRDAILSCSLIRMSIGMTSGRVRGASATWSASAWYSSATTTHLSRAGSALAPPASPRCHSLAIRAEQARLIDEPSVR